MESGIPAQCQETSIIYIYGDKYDESVMQHLASIYINKITEDVVNKTMRTMQNCQIIMSNIICRLLCDLYKHVLFFMQFYF